MSEDRRPRHRDERERREKKDGITRRDFLDGAAVSAAGLAAAAAFPGLTGAEAMAHGGGDAGLPASYYPPSFSDPYTGQPAQVIRRTIKIDGPPPSRPSPGALDQGRPRHPRPRARTRGEKYDCVIVGAGASGIAAAKWYQDRFGPNKKILIIDAAARLRRPLAPQRVAHPERGQRQRRRDDPAQRRHGQPRQHRQLGPGRAGRHPRLLRAAGGRLPRLGGRRHRRRARSGRTAAPPASRPRSGSTSGCCSPPASSAATTWSRPGTPARSPARSRRPSPAGRRS